jgi:hypothetical protein
MANSATPYGMVPVNLTGGLPFAGSTRMLPIASGYGTSIFFGDVVKIVNTGFIEKDTGTTTLAPIGVFMGCTYEDATYGLTFRQYYPANTDPQGSQSIIAYVCDDPNTIFKIQGSAAMTQTALFANAGVVQGAGSTISGNSGVTLDVSTINTTAALPLRIVGWAGNNVELTQAGGQGQSVLAPGDDFPDVLVRWNFAVHSYQIALAV